MPSIDDVIIKFNCTGVDYYQVATLHVSLAIKTRRHDFIEKTTAIAIMATMVCFNMLLRPAIRALTQRFWPEPASLAADFTNY